jgi:hemolysin III
MNVDKIIDERQHRLLTDMGPIYHETDLEHLDHVIVEPFNAFSSLAMAMAALLIWVVLVRKNHPDYPFLSYLFAPLIFIGGIGSTLFHGFRTSQFFLLMDWLPILLLTILLSLHYWYKVFPRWYFIVGMVFAIVFIRMLPMMFFQGSAAINVSYFVSGLVIIIPMIIFMVKTRFLYWRYVALSVVALLMALFFRYTDDFESLVLPMGTHWLWHVFSGIGAWFLGVYMYKTGKLTEEAAEGGELVLQRVD